jgi:RNase P/RNase MRP subunit POP5
MTLRVQFFYMPMMQIINNHSVYPTVQAAEKYISFIVADIYFHVLSKRIDHDIKLIPQTIEKNLGDWSLQLSNLSISTLDLKFPVGVVDWRQQEGTFEPDFWPEYQGKEGNKIACE